jgi:hypothetical protein
MATRSPFTHVPFGESVGASASVGAGDTENVQSVIVDEEEDLVDVLDSEGHFIMSKPRSVVVEKGFFHRGVHVYLYAPKTGQVLLGRSHPESIRDPNKWGCLTGRVESGSMSSRAALDLLKSELGIVMEPSEAKLLFSIKTEREVQEGKHAGVIDRVWLDVYCMCIPTMIRIDQLKVNLEEWTAVEYFDLDRMRARLLQNDPEMVIPKHEYQERLFQTLKLINGGSTLAIPAAK